MLTKHPTEQDLAALVGTASDTVAMQLRNFLDEHYTLDAVWDTGGKAATWQCRYRRGGKTLCTLLYKPGEAACMLIFGRDERTKAEALPLSAYARATYDTATTYHDGKWVWFSLLDVAILEDIYQLLPVKRKLMK